MQLLQSRSSGRRSRSLKFIVGGLVIVVGAGVWFGREPALLRYRMWKQDRALTQAREFIEKRDALNAQLALEVALKAVPGNPDTIRVAADMFESVGAPQAMRLRRAVVQIEPNSADDLAKLVLSCLRFRDFNAAKDALSNTPAEVAAQTPALKAALAYALATDDKPVADYLLTKLRTSFPDDKDLQHAHALLRLKHPSEAERAAAEKELEELEKSDPRLAPQINREFAAYALQQKNYPEAKRRLARILEAPDATFNDQLQLANFELLVDREPFESVFSRVAPLAAGNETDAAQFLRWLLVQNRAAEADSWRSELPIALQSSRSVHALEGEIAAQLGDWDRLTALLLSGAWGAAPKETIRLAIAAHTVDSPSKPALRRETWDLALSSASGNLLTLRLLQHLAAIWRWQEESERTLWAIANGFPDQTWAHQALFNAYREKKDTAAMRDVVAKLRESDGSVSRYHHDWALLTLLTNPTSSWNPAKDTMMRLHQSDPTNATYALGYAYALAQAGRAAEAVAIVDQMKEAERDYPPRQPYLAFIYGSAKQGSPMEHAVSLGAGVNYLPEENYLFTRGREELLRKPEKSKTAAVDKSGASVVP